MSICVLSPGDRRLQSELGVASSRDGLSSNPRIESIAREIASLPAENGVGKGDIRKVLQSVEQFPDEEARALLSALGGARR